MYLVSVGALDLGFRFVGPFPSLDEAQAWADRHIAIKTPMYDVLPIDDPVEAGRLSDTVPLKGE